MHKNGIRVRMAGLRMEAPFTPAYRRRNAIRPSRLVPTKAMDMGSGTVARASMLSVASRLMSAALINRLLLPVPSEKITSAAE